MGRGVQVRLAGPSGVAASRRVTTGEGAACAERATIDVHVGGFRYVCDASSGGRRAGPGEYTSHLLGEVCRSMYRN
jgi:hypothetical protein